MPYFPYTHLVFKSDKALVVSGSHFHVLSAHADELLHTTTTLPDDVLDKLRQSGPIRYVAVDIPFAHIATTADDKKLKIWKVGDTLELLSERELPKKPTEVGFTRDGQTIVISDKFGDVFSYPLHPEPPSVSSSTPPGASKRGSLNSHENPSNGTLILGHASLLTTFLLTPDERYIITPDRDEHIRVSWYPQGYAVERYCLGHEKFVSAVHIPSFKPTTLVSGGGDPVLKLWDWMSGKLLADIPVFQAAEPYIKVKAPKKRRGWADGDSEGDEGEKGQGQKKGKGKGRTGLSKGKGKSKEEVYDDSADRANGPEESGKVAATAPLEEVLVFVVHRILSVDRGEHGQFIIFSVVGSTALFYTLFPKDGGEESPALTVDAVDFGVPVVDFTTSENGDVWALVDAEWSGAQDVAQEDRKFARLLSWDGGRLSESTATEPASLLSTLNSKCLVFATPAELKVLDLYSDLSSMPKNVDPEHDPLIRDSLFEAAAIDPEADGKQLTQRELGRLKKKKALLAKLQEREGQHMRASREGSDAAAEAEAGREVKRSKSESTEDVAVAEAAVQDAGMDTS